MRPWSLLSEFETLTNMYLDPGCPSFLGGMSYKFVGYTPKKVGHPGSRYLVGATMLIRTPHQILRRRSLVPSSDNDRVHFWEFGLTKILE